MWWHFPLALEHVGLDGNLGVSLLLLYLQNALVFWVRFLHRSSSEPTPCPQPFPGSFSDTVKLKKVWKWWEKLWKDYKTQREQVLYRRERCAINVWEHYSCKFQFFLCSCPIFYIAGDFLFSWEYLFCMGLLHDMLQLLFQFHIIDP